MEIASEQIKKKICSISQRWVQFSERNSENKRDVFHSIKLDFFFYQKSRLKTGTKTHYHCLVIPYTHVSVNTLISHSVKQIQ